MCFSATASFTAASVISIIGICSIVKARTFPLLLLAITPLFFGLQQALEGIVWITLMQNDSTSLLHKVGVYGFLFFAGCFWPIWIPGCLCLIEKKILCKKLLFAIFVVGLIVSVHMLLQLIDRPHSAVISAHHIAYPMFALSYDMGTFKQHILSLESFFSLGYLLAIIMPFFISTMRGLWFIGAVTAIGFVIAAIFYRYSFGSIWCFFGALSTVATYIIIIKAKR